MYLMQGITIISILTALSVTTSAIARAMTSIFGRSGGHDTSQSLKYERALEIRLNSLADTLKILAGKVLKTPSVILGSVVDAILSL